MAADKEVIDIAEELYIHSNYGNYSKVKGILDKYKVPGDQPRDQQIARGLFGYSPLHAASSNGHYEVLKVLLKCEKADLDINSKTVDGGYTPLHLAASGGHLDCVNLLLQYDKIDMNVTDAFGRTPLETAEQNFKIDVANLLRSRAIIKAAEKENENELDNLLKTHQNKLHGDCYDKAFKVAFDKNKMVNAEKLILAGATNIGEVIESAKQVDVQLMLLMVMAVLEDDHQLILEVINIFKEFHRNKISFSKEVFSTTTFDLSDLTRDPKYAILYTEEMTEHIVSGKLRTGVPIKLAIKLKKPGRMIGELLSITNIELNTGSVGWTSLKLTELDIQWIRNLAEYVVIKQLNLSQNQLSILPISMAFPLRKCNKLDLHYNNIKKIPASILELKQIKELNLSHNNISELPNVSWSASLIQLNLSYNELKTLPDCASEWCANSMKVLQLEHNQLRKVPKCICFLHNLNKLDLSYNPEILVLPVDLGRLKQLDQLILKGLHHLYDPPPSVCENSAVCMSYLKSKFHKQSKYYHMKLMLVGKQTVGKTTIVACLQGKRYPNESTVGVDIGEWAYRLSLFKPIFYFSVWDFAGQEEYYATHQVFLSKRSLYLVVWNVMEGKDGIVELKPWLKNIISRVLESRIIIVATHLDLLTTELGREQAYAKCDEYRVYLTQIIGHGFIERHVAKVMFVGLKGKREAFFELKKEIYNAAEDYTIDGRPIMGFNIPSSYERVNNKLSSLSVPILHAMEFKEMVRSLDQPDLQSNDEIRALTLFLNDTGSLLHFDDRMRNLDDLYFVKPQWLCKLMSTVITVRERNEYIKDGKICKSDLEKLFQRADNNAYPERYLEQYLVLFNRFEIALPLDKEGDQLLIPCFLPSERPAIVGELSKAYHYQRQFVFCNAITPPGLWSRLLSRLMNTVAEVRNLLDQKDHSGKLCYWRKGLCYYLKDGLVFIIESCPLQDDGICIIYSFKAAQKGLLSQLVSLVQMMISEWYPGLQFEQIFSCYEECKGNFKFGEILNHIHIADNKYLNCHVCNKGLDLKALAPDLLLDDVDSNYILDINSIHHEENVVWSGKFGIVYRGDVHSSTPIIVKFYGTNEKNLQSTSYEAQFSAFRAEVTYLQRMKHPCLVGMIGVCKYPNLALVMEDGPMGSLDSCLLKELLEVPRIVVYRIATQIASALRFLHSIPVIYCHLITSRVFIWSLSLDDLINCKLAGLEIATYGDLGHAATTFTNKLIAPEISKQAIYDQRVDIFSLGVVILQMLQRSYPTEYRELIPEWEVPETLKSFPIPDSTLYHIRALATKCCSHDPIDRPRLQAILEQLCDPEFQLVKDVTKMDGNVGCACTGCVQHFDISTTASQSDHTSEAWISCQCDNGSEIIAVTLKDLKLETEKRLFIRDHQIYTMLSHDNCVWATSMQAGREGSLLKFDGNKKDEYIVVAIKSKVTEDDNSIPDGDYGISLACSGDHVYVGTINGWCLMFPIDVNNDTVPIREVRLSCNFIRSLIVVKETSLLWVSTVLHAGDQILFVKLAGLEFNQDKKGVNIDDYRVGNLFLSPDEKIVWTVHINGQSISAWSSQKRELICPFNSHKLLDEKTDLQKSRIASASVVLDTLWVGLFSGHILAVTATLSQRALIIMKPYDQMIQVLAPIFGRDDNSSNIISIGKDYALDKQSGAKKYKSLDIVLWEVVNAKYMLQINHLSTDNAWLDDASLKKVTNKFNESSFCDAQRQLHLVKNTEACPLLSSNIVSYYFDTEGGKVSIDEHSITIIVPEGAVAEGYKVQIEAAASLIGPYIIPKGFHPVSAYVWIGASYIFKKEIQVQIEHYAVLSHPKDILQMSILTACCKDKDGQGMYEMHEATYQPQCKIKESVCIYNTDHFCSNCLAKKNEEIPDAIVIYHMLPKSFESADVFTSEICFCYNLEHCKQTVEKRFQNRGWINNSTYQVDVIGSSNEQTLCLSLPSNNRGWIIAYKHSDKINFKKLNFRIYQTVAELKADEDRDLFPPRFIIDLMCLDRGCMLFAQCKISCVDNNETDIFNDLPFNIYVPAKRQLQTEIQKRRDVFLDNYSKLEDILETETLSGYFVSARIITPDDQDHIQRTTGRKDKARIVLQKISGALSAGLSGGFEDLLSIIETHGNQDSKRLADLIHRQL